jgi:quinol monooxygenase YgiN
VLRHDEEAEMYGTVARIRVIPGALDELLALASDEEELGIDGFVGQLVFRSDADPNEVWLAVVFTDEASYKANADSPEQDKRYRRMAELFAAEPEWHDGQVLESLLLNSPKFCRAA